jgi:hypothetical protein
MFQTWLDCEGILLPLVKGAGSKPKCPCEDTLKKTTDLPLFPPAESVNDRRDFNLCGHEDQTLGPGCVVPSRSNELNSVFLADGSGAGHIGYALEGFATLEAS